MLLSHLKNHDLNMPISTFFFVIFAFFGASLASSASASAKAAPTQVEVGLYLNNIPVVNLKEKKFQVDFNLWFRWQGNHINPMDSFNIFNGTIDNKEGLITKKIGGKNYALDNQTLKIQIEDNLRSGDSISYVADKENTHVGNKVTIPGWSVGNFDSYTSITRYKTNYGNTALASDNETTSPRYTFSIDLERAGYGYFLKYFSMLFLAAGVAFMGFIIKAQLIDTRFFLSTSAIFMAAFIGSSLSTSLPENNDFGLGDQLYHLTMLYIVFSTLIFIYEHKIAIVNEEKAAQRSKQWGMGILVSYLTLCVLIVR
jgi:hypothetical protein